MKFRKKPVVIEALQWIENEDRMASFVGMNTWLATDIDHDGAFYLNTLEGPMRVSPGDWVIRGVKGELYSCKPDIFELTYERVI